MSSGHLTSCNDPHVMGLTRDRGRMVEFGVVRHLTSCNDPHVMGLARDRGRMVEFGVVRAFNVL